MQTIIITGRLSKDAEMRQAGSSEVCGFDVAVDQGFGDRKVTNWFRCQYWGKRGASVQPYLLKGGNVTVSGELETSEYNGKLQLGIRVNEVQLPAKPQSGQRETDQSRENNRYGVPYGGKREMEPASGGWDDDSDSIPF